MLRIWFISGIYSYTYIYVIYIYIYIYTYIIYIYIYTYIANVGDIFFDQFIWFP